MSLRARAFRGAWLGAALLLGLGACALLPAPRIEAPEAATPPGFPPAAYLGEIEGNLYRITSASLLILTYRAGWLERLAHNHTITTSALEGLVLVADDARESQADLYFRPFDLVLDAPEARAAAGAGFESPRTEEDIAATRARMLGPDGFASNTHPFVQARIAPAPDPGIAVLSLEIRGERYEKRVPVRLRIVGDTLRAESRFQIDHREVGLEPYSAFAHAIGVARTVDVSVSLEAAYVESDIRASANAH